MAAEMPTCSACRILKLVRLSKDMPSSKFFIDPRCRFCSDR